MISKAIETFRAKYNLSDILSIQPDQDTIVVVTHNPKIWVDLPEFHEGFHVKMQVKRTR